jgi:hypothetical protein
MMAGLMVLSLAELTVAESVLLTALLMAMLMAV